VRSAVSSTSKALLQRRIPSRCVHSLSHPRAWRPNAGV
jgi:hypothetical protein